MEAIDGEYKKQIVDKVSDSILIKVCKGHARQIGGTTGMHLSELIARFEERVERDTSTPFDHDNWCIQVTSVGNQFNAEDHGKVIGYINGKFKRKWAVRLDEYYGIIDCEPECMDTPFAPIISFKQFETLLVK